MAVAVQTDALHPCAAGFPCGDGLNLTRHGLREELLVFHDLLGCGHGFPDFWQRPAFRVVLLVSVFERDEVELGTGDRSQRPTDAFSDVVGATGNHAVFRHVTAYMTTCAGWGCAIFFAQHPVPVLVEGHPPAVCVKCDAVLALIVNLNLGMVGSHMTLAAVLRRSCDLGVKGVPRVAGIARSLGAVWIEAAHAAVWPSVGIDNGLLIGPLADNFALAVAYEPDDAAVTLPAAINGVGFVRGCPCNLVGKHVVQTGEDLSGLRVVAGRELAAFLVVALRAVAWRHPHRHPCALMHPGIRLALLGAVAIDASDIFLRVP